ncbi:DUF2163 domain-containing protein [Paraburkholderia sp.]|uniref:DUF2163 domain-containing protein n=1 Tax=Paraburkholderia sp. TaxID=1926495 RepID=UPI003C7DBC1F
MKNVSSSVLSLLNSSTEFMMADLYTITLVGGSVLTYTSADVELTWNGLNYTNLGPKIQRDQVKTILGVQVDTLDVSFYPETTDLILGSPFLSEAMAGIFDGAWFSLDRAFLTNWTTGGIVGTVNMFSGLMGDCVIGRTAAKLTIKSPLDKLNMQLPKNVYESGCNRNLFDAGCGLNKAAFAVSGTVTVGSTGAIQSAINYVDGYFTLGSITFTSGVLNGQSRGVSGYANRFATFSFSYPFQQAPSPGDTFIAYPGCDHQQSTCTNKFNNVIHYRGFPFIPVPETAA